MKKKIIFVMFAFITLNSCDEADVYNVPEQIQDSEKTIHLILDNIPESYLEESVYIYTFSNEGVFSTVQTKAIEDSEVTINPPSGKKAFDIIAYIPRESNWSAGQNFSYGYYTSFTTTERGSYFITQTWEFAYSLSSVDIGISNTTIYAELYTDDDTYNKGDIISLDAYIEPILNSPINTVVYYLDNDEIVSYNEYPYDYSLNTKDINAGEHVLKVVATNEAGHSAKDEKEIWIKTEENEAPTVDIYSHENGDIIIHGSNELLYAYVNDPEGELNHVDIKINGNKVATLENSPWEYLWNTMNNTVGINTITFSAVDAEGAERSDEININIVAPDNYFPEITITDPNDGQYFTQGDNIYLKASASDVENEIKEVRFFIDGNPLSTLDSSPYSLNYDSSSLDVGAHTFKATVEDLDGATSSHQINFYIE